jgi:hypothetical protein
VPRDSTTVAEPRDASGKQGPCDAKRALSSRYTALVTAAVAVLGETERHRAPYAATTALPPAKAARRFSRFSRAATGSTTGTASSKVFVYSCWG